MEMKDNYIFNVLLDDDLDIVVLTVGGFKSMADREAFADDLHYTLAKKKIELYSQNTGGLDDFLSILNFLPKNVTIH